MSLRSHNKYFSNEIKFYIHTVILNVVVLFVTGAFFQTFLIEHGVKENTVNVYSSVMQIAQTLIMLLFSKVIDNIKNVIRLATVSYLASIPLIAFLLFNVNNKFTLITVVLLCVFGFIYNVGYGFYSILSYKLPYHIFDINNYGKITSTAGWMIGVFSVLVSFILSFFQNKYEYNSVMTFAFVVSFLLLAVYTYVSLSMKKIDINTSGKKEKTKINLFTYKPFYMLILPNLMRGFCSGVIMLVVTIGYYSKTLDYKSALTVVTISNTVTIVACMMYSFVARRIGEYRMILFSSIGVFMGMPIMFVFKNTTWYLAIYGVVYFLYIIINYAVPTAVTQIVDYEVMGQYTAWRMLFHTLGSSIAGFLCVPMLDLFGPFVAMIISGGLQLLSGIVYYFYIKQNVVINSKGL